MNQEERRKKTIGHPYDLRDPKLPVIHSQAPISQQENRRQSQPMPEGVMDMVDSNMMQSE